MMISIFSVPENMKLSIGLDDKTLALVDRIVKLYEDRKEIKELMTELDTSTDDLNKKVNENPDPNLND